MPYFAVEIEGAEILLNYGLDRVRFITPVKFGSEVRATGTIIEITKTPRRSFS